MLVPAVACIVAAINSHSLTSLFPEVDKANNAPVNGEEKNSGCNSEQ